MLGVSLIARTEIFEQKIEAARKQVAHFEDQLNKLKTNSSLADLTPDVMNRASFNREELTQLKAQTEQRIRLEDELYRATHSHKENDLRDNQIYFEGLKSMWKDNQGMLTMITETENAKREAIEKSYAERSTTTWIRSFAGRAGIIGVAVMAAGRIADNITSAHKQFRESERAAGDYIRLWASGIPIFGRVAESFYKMHREVTGLAELDELNIKIKENVEGLQKQSKELDFSLKLKGKTSEQAELLQAEKNYRDALEATKKDIADTNKELQRKYELELDLYNTESKRPSHIMGGSDIGVRPTLGKADESSIAKLETQYKNTVEDIKKKYFEAYSSLVAQLDKQAKTFSMTEQEVRRYSGTLGYTGEKLKELNKRYDELDKLDEAKKAEEIAQKHQQVIQGLKDYNEQLKDTNKYFDDGIAQKMAEFVRAGKELTGKDLEDYNAQLKITREELEKQDKLQKDKQAKADAERAMENKQNDLASRAKSIYESVRTPMEKYRDKLKEIEEIRSHFGEKGKNGEELGIDYETYIRALKKAKDELDTELGKGNKKEIATPKGDVEYVRASLISLSGQQANSANSLAQRQLEKQQENNNQNTTMITKLDALIQKLEVMN